MRASFTLISIILISLHGSSCSDQTDDDTVAVIDGDKIDSRIIDGIIQEQLYESLFGIYYKRKVALQEYVAVELFRREAQKRGVTVEALIASEVDSALTSTGFDQFVAANNLASGIPDPKDPFRIVSLSSEEGLTLAKEAYRQKKLEDFVENLEKIYNVKFLIRAPLPPKKDMKTLRSFVRGSTGSKLKIWIISDFNCESCRANHQLFNELFQRYREKFEFNYFLQPSQDKIANIGAKCASAAGRFWEYYDAVFSRNSMTLDSSFVKRTLHNLGVEPSCLSNMTYHAEVQKDLLSLSKIGITMTPTLVIFGRPYHGPLTLQAIESYVEDNMPEN